jgi:beta-glucosidase
VSERVPDGFAWGGVVRGGRAGPAPASDWSSLAASGEGRRPDLDELLLLADRGLTHIRFDIDWASVVPASGRVDRSALDELVQTLEAAQAGGLHAWAVLHDRPLPGWFVDEGSFADDRNRVWWSRWVELVADAVGDLVAGWMPLAEPVAWATDAYLTGIAPPFRRDPEAFSETLRGVHLAWRDAWRILRGGGPPVATCHRVGPVHAADATVTARQQTRLVDAVLWGSWVSGLRDGILRIPGRADEDVADLAASGDLLGITYEGALAVDGEGAFSPYPSSERVAQSGAAPWPEGLGWTLHRLADELPGRAVLVAGNGVGTADDELRADVLRETVDVLAGVLAEGIDLRGWFHRSAVDGDEWSAVALPPYGLLDASGTAKPSLDALATAISGG